MHLRLLSLAALVLGLSLLAGGCGGSSDEDAAAEETGPRTTLVAAAEKEPEAPLPKGDPPKKLVVEDLREGYGQEARPGDLLVTKLVARYITGKPFESSWDAGSGSFVFQLGKEQANPGWEKGIPGMKVGGKRLLIVPPDEGSRFGTVGEGKPKDTLVYVVELTAILPPELKDRKEPKVAPPDEPPPADLKVRDISEGTGPAAQDGDILNVQYVGIRYDGRHFTNSWKRKKQFEFELGGEEAAINPGWEEGLKGMRVGGRRELVIPPKLQTRGGAPSGAKPSDTLIYVIDLIGINDPSEKPPGGGEEASG